MTDYGSGDWFRYPTEHNFVSFKVNSILLSTHVFDLKVKYQETESKDQNKIKHNV